MGLPGLNFQGGYRGVTGLSILIFWFCQTFCKGCYSNVHLYKEKLR